MASPRFLWSWLELIDMIADDVNKKTLLRLMNACAAYRALLAPKYFAELSHSQLASTKLKSAMDAYSSLDPFTLVKVLRLSPPIAGDLVRRCTNLVRLRFEAMTQEELYSVLGELPAATGLRFLTVDCSSALESASEREPITTFELPPALEDVVLRRYPCSWLLELSAERAFGLTRLCCMFEEEESLDYIADLPGHVLAKISTWYVYDYEELAVMCTAPGFAPREIVVPLCNYGMVASPISTEQWAILVSFPTRIELCVEQFITVEHIAQGLPTNADVVRLLSVDIGGLHSRFFDAAAANILGFGGKLSLHLYPPDLDDDGWWKWDNVSWDDIDDIQAEMEFWENLRARMLPNVEILRDYDIERVRRDWFDLEAV